MRTFKYTALLAVMFSARAEEKKDLFSLDDDKYIIDPNTSAHEVLEHM